MLFTFHVIYSQDLYLLRDEDETVSKVKENEVMVKFTSI